MSKKELLFTVSAKDCQWDYLRGSGKGGQKKNKTSSAVRCRHLASGAIGYAEDTRSQSQNRRLAFVRMSQTPEFLKWHRIEVARCTGALRDIREKIDRETSNPNLTTVEVHNEEGRWVKAIGDYTIKEKE